MCITNLSRAVCAWVGLILILLLTWNSSKGQVHVPDEPPDLQFDLTCNTIEVDGYLVLTARRQGKKYITYFGIIEDSKDSAKLNQLQRALDARLLLKSTSKETFRFLKRQIDRAVFHLEPSLRIIYSSKCGEEWMVEITQDWFSEPVAISSLTSIGLLKEEATDYVYNIVKVKYRCLLVSFPSFKYYKRTQITEFFEDIHGEDELLIGAYYPVEPKCIRSARRNGKYDVLFPIEVVQ